MYFKQFYLACLAHASYLIGSEGEGAIVDPQRDVDQYIQEAGAQNLRIKYIVETHLHADFVSGHRELAARTGAEIVFGERAGAAFPHRAAREGDTLRVGATELRAIETPGHTPESMSWLITEPGAAPRLLTGDTLFIGDVGRPDLAGARPFSTSASPTRSAPATLPARSTSAWAANSRRGAERCCRWTSRSCSPSTTTRAPPKR